MLSSAVAVRGDAGTPVALVRPCWVVRGEVSTAVVLMRFWLAVRGDAVTSVAVTRSPWVVRGDGGTTVEMMRCSWEVRPEVGTAAVVMRCACAMRAAGVVDTWMVTIDPTKCPWPLGFAGISTAMTAVSRPVPVSLVACDATRVAAFSSPCPLSSAVRAYCSTAAAVR